MSSRAFWFAGGAAVGIYAMIRGRRAAEALTADGLRDRAQALAVGARMFRDEVASGRAEKETELRAQLGRARHTAALRAGRPSEETSQISDTSDISDMEEHP